MLQKHKHHSTITSEKNIWIVSVDDAEVSMKLLEGTH